MKRLVFICFFLIVAGSSYAQNLPVFGQVKLKKPKDFKVAEPAVLQTDDYVLATPVDQNIAAKTSAAEFLMKWMEGTPDYTFTLDEGTTKSFLQNTGLVVVYLSYMSRYAIQNKPKTSRLITISAIKNLLAYINNPTNHVTLTDDLKALSEANDKGQLESYLNL